MGKRGLYPGHSEQSRGLKQKSKRPGSLPTGGLHCLADLELVEKVKTAGWRVGVDGDQAKQPPLYFPNLYPPLTPVPQCVVEIRAIGQSPIHCHPEYFKVKPHPLTKKSYSSKVCFPDLPSLPSVDAHSPGFFLRAILSVGQHFVFIYRHAGEKFERCPAFYFDIGQNVADLILLVMFHVKLKRWCSLLGSNATVQCNRSFKLPTETALSHLCSFSAEKPSSLKI